jgi:protoporphyrinogen oxidase
MTTPNNNSSSNSNSNINSAANKDPLADISKGFGSFLGSMQRGINAKQEEWRLGNEAKDIGKIWDPKQK